MKLLIFDTETTGLPQKYAKVHMNDLQLWPEIVQISWFIYDDVSNKIISVNNHIIKVNNIPSDSTKIHKITNDMSRNLGKPITQIIALFKNDWDNSHIIVAHNKRFDLNIIGIESMRIYKKNIFENTGKMEYCSMKYGYYKTDLTYLCKYTKKYKKKNPALFELHKELFHTVPSNLHNAFIDILVCFRCTFQMIYNTDPLKCNIFIEMPVRETKSTTYIDDLEFKHVYNESCGL